MFASIRRVALLFVPLILVAACDKAPPKPAAAVALSRPLVTVQERNGRVLVPQSAITEQGGAPGVYVLATDRTARFRMVRTGKSYGGRVEILSGLSGDEMLVAGDLRDMHDGSRIQQD